MAAHMLVIAQPIGPTLPPSSLDAEMVGASTQRHTLNPQIIPKRVKTVEIDPCAPPEKPCC